MAICASVRSCMRTIVCVCVCKYSVYVCLQKMFVYFIDVGILFVLLFLLLLDYVLFFFLCLWIVYSLQTTR